MFGGEWGSQGLCLLGTGTSTEPRVELKLSPQREGVQFLVDAGAEGSTVQGLPSGYTLAGNTVNIIGAKRKPLEALGDLLWLPGAEYGLLRRGLVLKLNLSV